MTDAIRRLAEAGVSIWLDDLSRELLQTGELERLVRERGVLGITSNPTIFASAVAKGERYEEQIRRLAGEGADVERTVLELTTDDVRDACDRLMPVYQATGHLDGRVSIEVDPRLAHDTERTVEAARLLWSTVGRPNAMIKIPATEAGIPAIRTVLGEGISVNVTLIFSLQRYRAVMEAYLEGLELARSDGRDLAEIASVASFFISRVDSEVDARLRDLGGDAAAGLLGKAALANARLAYQAYEEVFGTPRWEQLTSAGARPQRPLWASTGVKDPAYPDTLYVTDLVATGTVNTMPGPTLEAVADHAQVRGDTVTAFYGESRAILDALAGLGIGYDDVTGTLEREGVAKFEKSWADLLGTVQDELDRAKAQLEGDATDEGDEVTR